MWRSGRGGEAQHQDQDRDRDRRGCNERAGNLGLGGGKAKDAAV